MQFQHIIFFKRANSSNDPAERIKLVTKYMLTGLVYERRSMKPKKPLNPILGEIFKCTFDCPLEENENGEKDSVRFDLISEQVSHHPPSNFFSIYYICQLDITNF